MGFDFKGKTVFLTGGQRGIGLCIKESFEANGAKVIVPSIAELDLTNKESVDKYLSTFNEKVDIFVHCAGMNNVALVEDLDLEDVRRVFEINYFSAVTLMKHFAPSMKKNNYGKVVFISSLYALVSREGRVPYSSSKNALTGLTKTLALELAPYNIMVNSVAPGYVMTEMTRKNLSDEEIKDIESKLPTGRFQEKEEIADAVMFLASENNKSITGQVLPVDGGFLCR